MLLKHEPIRQFTVLCSNISTKKTEEEIIEGYNTALLSTTAGQCLHLENIISQQKAKKLKYHPNY